MTPQQQFVNNKHSIIEEIGKKKQLVLFDNSAFGKGNAFLKKMFKITDFSSITLSDITTAVSTTHSMLTHMNKPNSKIIPEVLSELKDYERIVKDTLFHWKHITFQNSKEQIEQMVRLEQKVHDLVTSASESVIDFPNLISKEFLNLAFLLENILPIKKNDDKQFKDTDERLVALQLYYAVVEKQKTAIITQDKDLVRLTNYMQFVFVSKRLFPENYHSEKSLRKYRPATYYTNYYEPINAFGQEHLRHLRIKYPTSEDISRIKNEVRDSARHIELYIRQKPRIEEMLMQQKRRMERGRR